MLDKDGYPDDFWLIKLKGYDICKDTFEGFKEFLDELKENWNYAESGFRVTGKNILKLELHTLGWSGNEDIINSLEQSNFWTFWRKSETGGHYFFRIPKTFFESIKPTSAVLE